MAGSTRTRRAGRAPAAAGQVGALGLGAGRLDARIARLLIDEFRDTNPLQWQALYGWLSAYAGAGNSAPRVFIVGDPKQSIYRFRRAEAAGLHRREEVRARGPGRRAAQLGPHAPQCARRGGPRSTVPCWPRRRPASSTASAPTPPSAAIEGELLKLPAIDRDDRRGSARGRTGRRRHAALARQPAHAARAARASSCCRRSASRPRRLGCATHRRRHAARARSNGAVAPPQPAFCHAGRAAPAPHPRCSSPRRTSSTMPRGAGHGAR